jgi:hypothetical protein
MQRQHEAFGVVDQKEQYGPGDTKQQRYEDPDRVELALRLQDPEAEPHVPATKSPTIAPPNAKKIATFIPANRLVRRGPGS